MSPTRPLDVLFVAMPFGAVRPAIGASLLKAHLLRIGVRARIEYLNMRFAQRAGYEDYHYVSELAPSQSLAGDWVFASCLSPDRGAADHDYLADYLRRFSTFVAIDSAVATLKRCRAMASSFLDECLEVVDWDAYGVVGFTSTFSQHASSLALARRLKERHPQLVIAFGGANCEHEMGLQTHRSFGFIDYVCSGEADVSFPRLVQSLHRGEDTLDIPGVIARHHGESVYRTLSPDKVASLDDLPYPEYDDYFEQLASMAKAPPKSVCVLMESSRGCWWGEKHHCTFCGLNGTSMAFRSKSAKRVVEEMVALVQRYTPQYVEMVDNILDMKYFRDLIPELRRLRLGLGLFYETKANLTKPHLQALRSAGIATIQPGIESLSNQVLELMQKGTTVMQNVQLLKWCKELGIRPYWNLLYGFPGENPEEYEASAAMMATLEHLPPPHGVGAIRLDRFSPNFARASELGIVNVRPDSSYRHIYGLPDRDLAELAYYFEHEYADGRDPMSYTVNLRRAVRRWHENSATRGLLYADHGDALALWDFRVGARRTLTILCGTDREVYRYCDQNRTRKQIVEFSQGHAMHETEVVSLVERLVADKMMLHVNGRFLSLAVRSGTPEEQGHLAYPRSRALTVL